MHTSRTTPLAAATAALLLAGCGAAQTTSTPLASSSPKSAAQAAYKFSECMRRHGLSNFPDPVVHASSGHESVGIKVDPTLTGSAAFKSAQHACQGILPAPLSPTQRAAQEHYRQLHLHTFAQCMRSHRVNGFPDPNSEGQIPLTLIESAGINIHLPNVIAAARACVSASGGLLSQAAITQATSGGG